MFKAPEVEAADTPLVAEIPPLPRMMDKSVLTNVVDAASTSGITVGGTAIAVSSVIPRERSLRDTTPPRSPTEAGDASEEEECLELIYPSSAPEDSEPEDSAPEDTPEVEVRDSHCNIS